MASYGKCRTSRFRDTPLTGTIMKRTSLSKVVIASYMFLISAGGAFAQDWPGWRGDGQGLSPEKNLPGKWSETEGVKWKTPVPGAGHSSPIVWGQRVFLSTAVANDGLVYMPIGGVLPQNDTSLGIFSRSAGATPNSLEVHRLRSIWK